MGEGIRFELKDGGLGNIIEKPSGRIVTMVGGTKALCDYLNQEHAEGRVAQARCIVGSSMVEADAKPSDADAKPGKKGKAKDAVKVLVRRGGMECDYDRVNDPRLLTEAQLASLVLCPEHAAKIAAIIKPVAA